MNQGEHPVPAPKQRPQSSTLDLHHAVEPQAIRDEPAGRTLQFVSFTIGGEEYGVDIMQVREIKGWTPVTALPNQPDYMRGVINLRGLIVPIFDLACRFGMGTTEATKTHVVIVFSIADRIMGILVDAVSDILTVGETKIRPVPETDHIVDQDFLTGLVTVDDRMVAILALDQLFAKSALGDPHPPDSVAAS